MRNTVIESKENAMIEKEKAINKNKCLHDQNKTV